MLLVNVNYEEAMRTSSIDRKAQILSEATKLFSEFGYDKVTIKILANACGITEPALYRHYVSKDAIYDAVLDTIEKRILPVESIFNALEVHDDLERRCRIVVLEHPVPERWVVPIRRDHQLRYDAEEGVEDLVTHVEEHELGAGADPIELVGQVVQAP